MGQNIETSYSPIASLRRIFNGVFGVAIIAATLQSSLVSQRAEIQEDALSAETVSMVTPYVNGRAQEQIVVQTVEQLKEALYFGKIVIINPSSPEYQDMYDYYFSLPDTVVAKPSVDNAETFELIPQSESDIFADIEDVVVVDIYDYGCISAAPDIRKQPLLTQQLVEYGHLIPMITSPVMFDGMMYHKPVYIDLDSTNYTQVINDFVENDSQGVIRTDEDHGALVLNTIGQYAKPEDILVICHDKGYESALRKSYSNFEAARALVINTSLYPDARYIESIDELLEMERLPPAIAFQSAGNDGRTLALPTSFRNTLVVLANIQRGVYGNTFTDATDYSATPNLQDTNAPPGYISAIGTKQLPWINGQISLFSGTSEASPNVAARVIKGLTQMSAADLKALEHSTPLQTYLAAINIAGGEQPRLTEYTFLQDGLANGSVTISGPTADKVRQALGLTDSDYTGDVLLSIRDEIHRNDYNLFGITLPLREGPYPDFTIDTYAASEILNKTMFKVSFSVQTTSGALEVIENVIVSKGTNATRTNIAQILQDSDQNSIIFLGYSGGEVRTAHINTVVEEAPYRDGYWYEIDLPFVLNNTVNN